MQQKDIFNPAYRRLVNRLHDARINRGMTLQTAAGKVGRRASWLSKVERYELALGFITLVCLARTYGLRTNKLIAKLEEELSPEEGDAFLYLSTPTIHHVRSYCQ